MKLLLTALVLCVCVFPSVSFAADEEPEERYRVRCTGTQLFKQQFQPTDGLVQGERLEGLLSTTFYKNNMEQSEPLYGTLGISGVFYRVYFPAGNLNEHVENLVDGKTVYVLVEAEVQSQDGRYASIEITTVTAVKIDFDGLLAACADDFTRRFDAELQERYPEAPDGLVSEAERMQQEGEEQLQQRQSDGGYRIQPDPFRLEGMALDWDVKTKTVGVYFNEQYVYLERAPYAGNW